MANASGVLVIAETAEGKPTELTNEMLGLARRVSEKLGGSVSVALLGSNVGDLPKQLIAQGADKVFVGDAAVLGDYQSDAWMPYVQSIAEQTSPAAIFVAHTTSGADLAPRVAFRLHTAVAMGCTEMAVEGGKLMATRPCYGNLAREVLSVKTTPIVATIKSKTQEPLVADASRTGEIMAVNLNVDPASIRTKIVDRKKEQTTGVRLESAKVIIAGGRGLGGPDGFKVLEKLAGLLGGAVGASRVACDLGWCPPSWQIGLTGKTVTPDLYVAVGISGASHHLAGIGGAKNIVAINNDPDAAMFKEARFGIVGDYNQVVPAMIEEIQKMGG